MIGDACKTMQRTLWIAPLALLVACGGGGSTSVNDDTQAGGDDDDGGAVQGDAGVPGELHDAYLWFDGNVTVALDGNDVT